MTTTQRQRQYQLEKDAAKQLIDNLRGQAKMFAILKSELEDLQDENLQVARFLHTHDLRRALVALTGVAVYFLIISVTKDLPSISSSANSINVGVLSPWPIEVLSPPIGILITTVLITIGVWQRRSHGATEQSVHVTPAPRRPPQPAQDTKKGGGRKYSRWRPHQLKLQRDFYTTTWRGTSHETLKRRMISEFRKYTGSDSDD